MLMLLRFIVGAEKEESGHRLDNVNRTHLVLQKVICHVFGPKTIAKLSVLKEHSFS